MSFIENINNLMPRPQGTLLQTSVVLVSAACFALSCAKEDHDDQTGEAVSTDTTQFGKPEFHTDPNEPSDPPGTATDTAVVQADTADVPDVSTGGDETIPGTPSVSSFADNATIPSHDLYACDSCITLENNIKGAAREVIAMKMLQIMTPELFESEDEGRWDDDEEEDIDWDDNNDDDWDDGSAADKDDSSGDALPTSSENTENVPSHSETNTQEKDVDEADIVKTDGTYIYVLSSGELVIVEALPNGALETMGRLPTGGTPLEMMIYSDLIVTFASLTRTEAPESLLMDQSNTSNASEWSEQPQESYTFISLIDISNRAQPTLLRSVTYTGKYVTSRRVGDALRVIIQSPIPAFQLPISASAVRSVANTEDNLDVLFMENAAAIETITLDQILPKKLDQVVGAEQPSEPEIAVACTDTYGTTTATGIGMTTIVSLALDYPLTAQRDVAVFGDVGTVYASQSSLYLATDRYFVLSANEQGLWAADTTGIHKFDIATNRGMAIYQASGEVTGHLLNQFSMGDHNGFLRVATSTGSDWNTEDNHLSVLEQSNESLTVVAQLDGIGQYEDLYAARFMGNRGFIVTFREWDPLFTFDLSDPYDPKVVGEWEGPGYSTYLHPIGANHLLALGEDGGMAQISLFDLTDFATPTLEVRLNLPGYSYALYDHKAFTYFAPESLAAVPYHSGGTTGIAMYTANEAGLAERGQMSFGNTEASRAVTKRSVIIGNTIYAISDCDMVSADLNTPNLNIAAEPLFSGLTCSGS